MRTEGAKILLTPYMLKMYLFIKTIYFSIHIHNFLKNVNSIKTLYITHIYTVLGRTRYFTETPSLLLRSVTFHTPNLETLFQVKHRGYICLV